MESGWLFLTLTSLSFSGLIKNSAPKAVNWVCLVSFLSSSLSRCGTKTYIGVLSRVNIYPRSVWNSKGSRFPSRSYFMFPLAMAVFSPARMKRAFTEVVLDTHKIHLDMGKWHERAKWDGSAWWYVAFNMGRINNLNEIRIISLERVRNSRTMAMSMSLLKALVDSQAVGTRFQKFFSANLFFAPLLSPLSSESFVASDSK